LIINQLLKFKLTFVCYKKFEILLTSCVPSNYSDVRQMGYNYTTLVESEDRIEKNVGAYGASYNSQ